MKFGHLIGIARDIGISSIIMQKMKTGKLVLDLFLLFKKALCEVKASGLQLSFIIFR